MTQKMMGMSKNQDRDFIPVSSMQTYILQCCPNLKYCYMVRQALISLENIDGYRA